MARTIADSDIWIADHLVIVVGLILMLGGLLAISDSIQGGLSGALARLGCFAAVAGIVVGVIDVILDGVAAKHIADAWAVAPPEEEGAALRLVLAEEIINSPWPRSSTSFSRASPSFSLASPWSGL